MRKLTDPQIEMLKHIWNLAHARREHDRGIVRWLRGGHHENQITHDALLRRGLIRESPKSRYTRLTAPGMRLLGVKASAWSWLE